jgi:hypothetical protein
MSEPIKPVIEKDPYLERADPSKHPERGMDEVDTDDLVEQVREQADGDVPTLTPSPTARTDEDPSALPESNIAGMAPVQGG